MSPDFMYLDQTWPPTTRSLRTGLSFAESLSSASSGPGGSFLNASSVGAKIVNGPFPVSLSVRPAVLTPATSVVKLPAAIAVSRMFFEGAVWVVLPCWLAEALFDSFIDLGLDV